MGLSHLAFSDYGYLKEIKNLFLRIVPFVWILASIINLWGDYKNFWVLKPKLKKRQYLTTMPLSFGLYPALGAIMIYLIRITEKKAPFWILTFSCLTTFAESFCLIFGKAKYGNGWNTLKTFFSYLVPYYLVYRYYKLVYK
ncbi:hypothetical protein ACFFH4_18670 [Halalkalibacter alkalisediminis]|uniref:Uncharacterized protein n=1 Tax=Halalkalibacter alkalisediminis TaxID=935616 RepID=A0ABV6NLI4_9BACI|nr:hypothetical protein [Halalkalibacter alkalisediminis]